MPSWQKHRHCGSSHNTVNCAEIHALLWGMSKFKSLWVSCKVLVLGNSYLIIDFYTCRAWPLKPELFGTTNEIAVIF